MNEQVKEPMNYESFFEVVRQAESKKYMNEQIKKQIDLLLKEEYRVKTFLNENGFDCTTAPFVLAKEYRDRLKEHIKILRMNLED